MSIGAVSYCCLQDLSPPLALPSLPRRDLKRQWGSCHCNTLNLTRIDEKYQDC
ncbi:hypothetical protein VDT1_4282 [Vibrio sp. 16]|nr:hypothetical protein VDT1_4282 [Vibrio sp. 16]